MTGSPTLKATPKRKRDDVTNEHRNIDYALSSFQLPKSTFSFQPPTLKPVERSHDNPLEDGNSSPRTRVAQKFQDLALGSGGGVTHNDKADASRGFILMGSEPDGAKSQRTSDDLRFSPEVSIFDFDGGNASSTAAEEMELDDADSASRKRVKLPDKPDTAEIVPNVEANTTGLKFGQSDLPHRFAPQTAVDPAFMKITKNEGSGRLQKSYPSINRLSASKSRSRKRAGTPPLTKQRTPESSAEEASIIIDPVRAALTWHEDEITVYDPEDKDDDGTGINGIGFRPTPAIAYARAQKRRQQLANYRKREESEARARRNQRRRQEVSANTEMESNHSMVRVHFSDAEPATVVMT